ncbi:type II toxin-antitoxin system RelE/ParE family toxin [Rhizobium sullae]|uniref:Type II toxin-antitoxin system RelE/ParE family toxin n=1 Tax=Rhizobium sullae TaxID=50338 RepID=A0ABY5XJQ0_RHISU|nr:hypothetical protein [Rhizobium sullae]UWU14668.1 type II toxin-antitoxin system RelE/ParE family toxin [Rhizobium sullae]
MIRSFKDAKTEAVASGKAPKGFPADLVWPAVRKLMVIETACIPEDIRPMSGTVAHDGTRDEENHEEICEDAGDVGPESNAWLNSA